MGVQEVSKHDYKKISHFVEQSRYYSVQNLKNRYDNEPTTLFRDFFEPIIEARDNQWSVEIVQDNKARPVVNHHTVSIKRSPFTIRVTLDDKDKNTVLVSADTNADVINSHLIFDPKNPKDYQKFGKKGEILDEDSNEFYEVLASELASIKGTKVGLEKIEKQTIGQTDQLDEFRKEFILRDTYIKYRKIWKIYARHKKNGIK